MPVWAERTLAGWGRVMRATNPAARPERVGDLGRALAEAGGDSLLAYGAGRSYGDAALNSAGRSIIMRRLDRLLDFDPASGRLVAEAGATFADVIDHFLPRGFMVPVAPGTGFATLGGGVANDVHGKNHHQAGSLGHHIEWLDLRMPDGRCRRVEPQRDADLFKATLGGLGLTGIIERLCLRLRPVPSNALHVRKRRMRNLDEFLEAFAQERDRAEYVVGWIDALAGGRDLGRGVLEAASPSAESVTLERARPHRVPVDFPAFALNPLTVRVFNRLYYARVPASGREYRQAYSQFLFPLDAVLDWNRIYGRRGFHQFQCVVPFEGGRDALAAMLELIAGCGRGSFLAVLKQLGPAGMGYLSFPQPGYTLALDFPNAPGVADLIGRLERIVGDAGGRVYLAKDSTLTPEGVRRMYPELPRFREILEQVDPQRRMQSDLARRLRLREPTP
jgi:decaprenylphospho-beta-D-ribofuranose 2-oxidase